MGYIIRNGIQYGGGSGALSDLSDVAISSVSDGQVLKYDSATQKWKNGTGGSGGASSLSDLDDVSLSSVTNGQVLSYDSTAQKWENTTPFSGNYNDLTNKPTIPTVDQSYSASSTNAQSGTAVANAISGKVDSGKIVLAINPTDAPFKATPGAIWIEP